MLPNRTGAGDARAEETTAGPVGRAIRVLTEEGGGKVWQPLRDLWLTNSVMAKKDTSQNGAYGWQAANYVPIFAVNDEGRPKLMFARD